VRKSITEIRKGFQKHFDTNNIFPSILSTTANYDFDIIEFDKWLHSKGYTEEKHGSMKDFVNQRYGKEARRFIESLLKSN